MTTRCHSVRSRRSPELRSFQFSDVARLRWTILVPSWVLRVSGSRPRLPIRITLLTLPAMPLPSRRVLARRDPALHRRLHGRADRSPLLSNVLALFIPHRPLGIKAAKPGFARPATGLQPIGNLAA